MSLASLWRGLIKPRAARLGLYSVYDGGGLQTFLGIGNVLLFAASWARHVAAGGSPLVIRTIHLRNERLARRLEALGARVEPVDRPHRLHPYSATYNKLLGLVDQGRGEPRLLLDNDMAFVSGIASLEADAREFAMADFADRQRVPPDIVAEIRLRLGLEMLQGPWRPLKESYDAMKEGRVPPVYHDMYFSSGAVISPANATLPRDWERDSARICEHFRDRYEKQKQRGAFGSDQLGLATAMRAQPRFKLLPAGYNYRMFGFQCGHLPIQDIHIVHHVGIRRAFAALDPGRHLSLSAIMSAYYDHFMLEPVRQDGLPQAEERAAMIREMRDRVLAVIRDLDIEDLRQVAPDAQRR